MIGIKPVDSSQDLPMPLRWLSLIVGVSLSVLLITAHRLTPSPTGIGTHQQLGLPPCASLALWDGRCPACGMTTSWAWAVRGQWRAAAETNAGGLLLAIIALASIPASCYFLVTGHATRGYWFSTALLISVLTALTAAVVQWLMRLLA